MSQLIDIRFLADLGLGSSACNCHSRSLLQYHDTGARELGKGLLELSDVDFVRAVPSDCAAMQIISGKRVILTLAVPTKLRYAHKSPRLRGNRPTDMYAPHLSYAAADDKWDKDLEEEREDWIRTINALVRPV